MNRKDIIIEARKRLAAAYPEGHVAKGLPDFRKEQFPCYAVVPDEVPSLKPKQDRREGAKFYERNARVHMSLAFEISSDTEFDDIYDEIMEVTEEIRNAMEPPEDFGFAQTGTGKQLCLEFWETETMHNFVYNNIVLVVVTYNFRYKQAQ